MTHQLSHTPKPIIFGSVCSGIEAVSVATAPLGWQAAWFAEIERFPCAVLAHHYPEVPNLGDMTKIAAMVRDGLVAAPDVLVGGTPCQAFSIAGLRAGLADARGALTLSFVELANEIDETRKRNAAPSAIVWWENVPGVLSSKDNAFGCFLGALAGEDSEIQPTGGKWSNAGCVYGPQRTVAWRVMDAQYFGVAQRRRRVFVVASARADFDPEAVLFEFDGMRRDSPPSRESWQETAGTLASRTNSGGFPGTDEACSGYLQPTSVGGLRFDAEGLATTTAIQECGLCASEPGEPDVWREVRAVALRGRDGGATAELGDDLCNCLRAGGGGGDKAHVLAPITVRDIAGTITSNYGKQIDSSDTSLGPNVVLQKVASNAFAQNSRDEVRLVGGDGEIVGALAAQPGMKQTTYVAPGAMAVRRLTPRECERLQGFEDDYTLIPHGRAVRMEKLEQDWVKYLLRGGRMTLADVCRAAADGPRYKALGNSMCVFNMRWIARRITAVVTRAEASDCLMRIK